MPQKGTGNRTRRPPVKPPVPAPAQPGLPATDQAWTPPPGVRLLDTSGIHPAAECTYRTLTAAESKATAPLHYHDFFELFLVTEGSVDHVINGKVMRLSPGDCVFIRPNDVHRFEPVPGSVGRFVNVEISRATIAAMEQFLGTAFRLGDYLKEPMPVQVRLDPMERERLQDYLHELYRLPFSDAAAAKMRLRTLLAFIFTRYFSRHSLGDEATVPQWIRELCVRMHYRNNFTVGVPRMVELASKSPAYLSRVFRAHLGQTPSEFVNHIRLNYAANLLAHSEYKIAWIARESGFPNVSNFYTQFQRVFKRTPAAFRTDNRGGPELQD